MHNSLRIRYIASLLLVMVPILALAVILVSSSRERSVQYINNSALQNFTYATENISAVLNRLGDSAATAFNVESEIHTDDQGNVSIHSEEKLCAALDVLEDRISPQNVTALFYIKGDQNIYAAQGKMRYGQYEHAYQQNYDLSSSGLYTYLQTLNTQMLLPLYGQGRDTLRGMVYAQPFPTVSASKGVLLFILSNDVIASEFENYLGEQQGSLYLYNDRYGLMYEAGSETTRLSPAQAMKIRGVGVKQMQGETGELVVLRVTDSFHGLNWVWAVPHNVFYGSMLATQRLMLLVIGALLLVTVVMLVGVAFFNYKPIQDLLVHVTGSDQTGKTTNELEAIRGAYDQTVDEAEALATRLNEMTPLVAQQLVRQLIFGRIDSPASFHSLASLADMNFSHVWTAALYLSFSRQDSDTRMEQAELTLAHFAPAGVFMAVGELPLENALCVLLNYDAAENETQTAEDFARQLYACLAEENAQPLVIGVGRAYESPLQMNESFAEACAAVQLTPAGETVWRYGQNSSSSMEEETGLHGLSPLSVSLLAEGLHRGDKSIVMRALNDMLDRIAQTTHSLAYFRFCCADLLSVIVRQAEALQLPVSKTRFQHLVAFTTQEEFRSAIFALADELCDAMKQRISDNDRQLKENLLNYILTNYKQPELSIQTVADATGVRKAQISTLIKEETGLGFVQYVSFLRMNEFKRLLVQSDETIRELVLQIGYNDVPNFLRKFKSLEGMTPGQYRQMRKPG